MQLVKCISQSCELFSVFHTKLLSKKKTQGTQQTKKNNNNNNNNNNRVSACQTCASQIPGFHSPSARCCVYTHPAHSMDNIRNSFVSISKPQIGVGRTAVIG